MSDLAAELEELAAHPLPAPSGPSGGVTAIVADGHSALRDAVALLLADSGIEVVATVARGDLVEDVLVLYDPDVLLIADELPGVDGITLIARLARHGARAAMVLYAENDDEVTVAQALTVGAAGVIAQARPVTQLAQALRTAAAGGLWLGESGEALAERQIARPARPRPELSQSELRVIELLAGGSSTEAIAARLFVSPHTVRTHLKNLTRKLDAHSRAHAVAIALREGLID